jgi:histidine triad (HIT) family protein
MTSQSCIFCKIIAKELPAQVIDQTDDLIVIADIHPKAPTHYLIITKVHIPKLSDTPDQKQALLGNILLMAKKLSQRLPIENQDFRLVCNNGSNAGQIVFHLHFHFLAGKSMRHELGQELA